MSVNGGPTIVTNGLVLDLDAANIKCYSSGAYAYDLSGNNHIATLQSGSAYTSSYNGGFGFIGSSNLQRMEIPNSPSLNPTSSVTLCAFFKVNSYDSHMGPIIFKQNTRTANYEQYNLFVDSSGINLAFSNNAGTQKTLNTPYTLGTLVHVVGVIDVVGSLMSLYVNGVLKGTLATAGITFDVTTTPVTIGGIPVSSWTGWTTGVIYNAQIYNTAFTKEDVAQNYNAMRGRYAL